MKQFSENIVKEINERKLVPRPRWHFYLRDSFLWGLVLITTTLGGLAVATLIFLTANHDWTALRYIDRWAWYFLVTIPYLWFFALGALLVVTWQNFFRTKYGYRHDAWFIGFLSIAGSLVIGTFFYFIGAGAEVHTLLLKRVRYYPSAFYTDEAIWSQPEHGFLSGKVVIFEDDGDFLIEDASGREWRILTDDNTYFESEKTVIVGERLRFIGKIGGDGVFIARAVRR